MMNRLVRRLAAVPAVAGALFASATPAHAQTEPYLGQVMCGAWPFVPNGWAAMNGQLMPIAQNTALFSLLGVTYGGDGVTTFALPDLRGRMMLQYGQGVGLSPHALGEKGGTESVNLTVAQMPAHNHGVAMPATDAPATSKLPGGRVPARGKSLEYAEPPADSAMMATATSVAGSGAPVSKMPPYLALNCVIATYGVWPPHN